MENRTMNQKNIRSYSELIKLETFEGRYEYLRLNGRVGEETFGYDRYLNQMLYKLPEWQSARNDAIVRDDGCDLGCPERKIPDGVLIMVHHINPITKEDILSRNPCLFDLENLITTIKITHDAIHYGSNESLQQEPIVRTKNDTCPWRH